MTISFRLLLPPNKCKIHNIPARIVVHNEMLNTIKKKIFYKETEFTSLKKMLILFFLYICKVLLLNTIIYIRKNVSS